MAISPPATVYLALGSNIGARLLNLETAIGLLPPPVCVTAASPVYETPPWGFDDQPAFLNQVVQATTDLEPLALLRHLKAIEQRMGRVKTLRNGPRLIDLDLLFYNDLVYETEDLVIPHPRLRGRGFVLKPLSDLAPELNHPVYRRSVVDLLSECDLTGIHRRAPAPRVENCTQTPADNGE